MKTITIKIPRTPGIKLAALTSLTAVIVLAFWIYTESINHYITYAAMHDYTKPTKLSVKDRITIATNGEYKELLHNLSWCESYQNEFFHGVNADGSVDRGAFAINNKWQAHVSDECAFNVECAARYTLKRIKEGDAHLWLCMKKI